MQQTWIWIGVAGAGTLVGLGALVFVLALDIVQRDLKWAYCMGIMVCLCVFVSLAYVMARRHHENETLATADQDSAAQA